MLEFASALAMRYQVPRAVDGERVRQDYSQAAAAYAISGTNRLPRRTSPVSRVELEDRYTLLIELATVPPPSWVSVISDTFSLSLHDALPILTVSVLSVS